MNASVRDNRRSNWGWFNYEVLDQHGAAIGPNGIAVYMALVRFANNETQAASPAVPRIAKAIGLSERTVQRTLALLETAGLIAITPRYTEDGDRTSNLYTLLDLSVGGDTVTPGVVSDSHHGGDTQSPKQDYVNKTNLNEREIAPALAPVVATGDMPPTEPPPARPVHPVPKGTPVNRRPDAPSVQPRPPKTPIADDWQPDAATMARAKEKYPQLSEAARVAALDRFRLHYEASGDTCARWGAKYLEWLDREVHDYGPRGLNGKAPPTGGRPYRLVTREVPA